MRRAILFAGLLVPVLACLPPQAEPPHVAYTAIASQIRDAPSVDGQVIALVAKGSAVHVGTCAAGWCGVATSAVQGFTEEAYLSDSLPAGTAGSQTTGRGYWNAFGEWVRSPTWTADGSPPTGATAQCRDASYSFSNTRRGTCSWHGGVSRWLPRADSIRR